MNNEGTNGDSSLVPFSYIYAQNKHKTMKIYHFERNIRLFLSL